MSLSSFFDNNSSNFHFLLPGVTRPSWSRLFVISKLLTVSSNSGPREFSFTSSRELLRPLCPSSGDANISSNFHILLPELATVVTFSPLTPSIESFDMESPSKPAEGLIPTELHPSSSSKSSSNFHLRLPDLAELSLRLLLLDCFLKSPSVESDNCAASSFLSNFLCGCCRDDADLSFVFLIATGFFNTSTETVGRVSCGGADDSITVSVSNSSRIIADLCCRSDRTVSYSVPSPEGDFLFEYLL